MRYLFIDDLRALGIGILSFYATKAIDRYIARRTQRARQQEIRQAQAEISLLVRLGSADRALLLFGFRFLFPLLALASLSIVVQPLLALVRGSADVENLVGTLVWSVIGISAFYASSVFRKLDDPQQTLDGLRQRIRELEAQDDSKNKPNG